MTQTAEDPNLNFFGAIPDQLMEHPPLCSSLQSLETCFFLISIGRYPHALTSCASSIESAMKSFLNKAPEEVIKAGYLYYEAIEKCPGMKSFNNGDLKDFRDTRNRIAHYGFSPHDDEETAILLLKTGFPFLTACYKEFFKFDLFVGLITEIAEQLSIALEVYQKTKDVTGLYFPYCFQAFGHLIRWGTRQTSVWENKVSKNAEECGIKYDHCMKLTEELDQDFGESVHLHCPICGDFESFICEVDQEHQDDQGISLIRGLCVNCNLVIKRESPFLIDTLCKKEIERNDIKIFYGG